MEAKDKAIELIELYRPNCRVIVSGYLVSNEDTTIKAAKQCALIAVDEIIKQRHLNVDTTQKVCDILNYWQKVRTEIEKLK